MGHRDDDGALRCCEGILIALAIVFAVLTIFFCLAGRHAHAAAPPPGSEQYEMLHPYADWVQGLTNSAGQGCCSLADCRVVDYRSAGAGYEAFISRRDFDGAPDRFVAVPDYVVVHKANPTGFAVACWAAWHKDSDGFFCFTPASGT